MCPKLSHLWLHDPVRQTKTGVVSARAHPAVSNLQPHSAFINSAAGSKLTPPVETEMNHERQTLKIQQEDLRRPLHSPRDSTQKLDNSHRWLYTVCRQKKKPNTFYYWPLLKNKNKKICSWTVSSLWFKVSCLPMSGWHEHSIYSSSENILILTRSSLLVIQSPLLS